MKEKNIRFAKLHIVIQGILICIVLLHSLENMQLYFLPTLIVTAVCTLADVITIRLVDEKYNRALAHIRFTEIIAYSIVILFDPSSVDYVLAILCVLMLERLLELVYLYEYSDSYTRIIIIGLASFPITLLIIIRLLLEQNTNPGALETMGYIAIVTSVILVVATVAGLFSDWISGLEKSMFGQRRLTENAKDMNETLRIHQEKIKKANEDLGIQRIKMERASRMVSKANTEMAIQNEVLKCVANSHEYQELADSITGIVIKNTHRVVFCAILIFGKNRYDSPIFSLKIRDEDLIFENKYREFILNESRKSNISKKISVEKLSDEQIEVRLPFKKEVKAIARLPLIKEDELIGIMYCGSSDREYFDESTRLFENISAEVLLSLHNIDLYSEVQRMAITDGLTGLYNRRMLNKTLEDYSEIAENEKKYLSLIMLDIDHFKLFNDTYGHACGDMVLTELAIVLSKWAFDCNGIAARYGGEEFVLAFLNRDNKSAGEIAASIKDEIENSVYFYNGNRVNVTVSIGYATYPETCTETEKLLRNVDAALYYSKEHGRNRITKDSAEVLAYFDENGKSR